MSASPAKMSCSSSTPSSRTLGAAPSLLSYDPATPTDTSWSREDPPADAAPPAEPEPSLAQATDPSALSSVPEVEPDFDQLNQLSLTELYPRYKELCEADDEYRRTGNTRRRPHELLPNGLIRQYRSVVERAKKRGDEPSISSDLLAIWEVLEQAGEWKRLRRMDQMDKLAGRLMPVTGQKREAFIFADLAERMRQRQHDILWLDDVWQRCVAFEAENDITDTERVKERFRRFPHGIFPRFAERNAAERQATEENSS